MQWCSRYTSLRFTSIFFYLIWFVGSIWLLWHQFNLFSCPSSPICKNCFVCANHCIFYRSTKPWPITKIYFNWPPNSNIFSVSIYCENVSNFKTLAHRRVWCACLATCYFLLYYCITLLEYSCEFTSYRCVSYTKIYIIKSASCDSHE